MRFNDAVGGAVLVIFALAVILHSRTFPTLHGQAYGPSLFPTLIGVGLLACGVLLIVRGLAARRRASELAPWLQPGGWIGEPARRLDVALVLAAILAYILLSTSLGFVPLSIAILWGLLFRFGSGALTALGYALGATLALQLLFAKVLLVPLPAGLLQAFQG